MSFRFPKSRGQIAVVVVLALAGARTADAAMDPRFELDQQTLQGSGAAGAAKTAKRRPRAARPAEQPASETYTVRRGDNLFKVLMRDYGLSNDEAEACVEALRRENNIRDIRRLRVGQRLNIPLLRRKAAAEAAGERVGQTLRLQAPAPVSEREVADQLREVWEKLVPAKSEAAPLTIQSPTFSLSLDPQRYPVYAAMDGAKILVDFGDSLPPLVRSLINEKDPTIRIVSGSSGSNRQLMAAMLASAGFYSVEENFHMDFGGDPRISVRSDFKVEKTPESLARQDLVLLNSGRRPLPDTLSAFLLKEGFTVYEPFASRKGVHPLALGQVHQITTRNQTEMVDAILGALAVNYQPEHRLNVFGAENSGISLSVLADRYLEAKGQRVVVTRFNGDPITYTLFRILETKGYQVVILEQQDDFRKVAEKLLGRLRIPGQFARHELDGGEGGHHAVQLSGFRLEGKGSGDLYLTDRELDRLVRDVLREDGYAVHGK